MKKKIKTTLIMNICSLPLPFLVEKNNRHMVVGLVELL